MGQQVQGLEVVLGDGTVVRTKPIARQSSGPMLNGIFAGAEGTMGVVTEATIELFAQPEAREFATVGFESFEAGYPAVVRMFDMGLIPALVDLTEEEPGEDAAGFRCLLYLGFERYREEVAAQRTRSLAEAVAAGGTDLGPTPTQHYWDTRHAIAERWRDNTRPLRPTERWRAPRWRSTDHLHVSLPVSRVLEYKRRAAEIAAAHGIAIREAAVWTDPRLYSLFLIDPRSEAEVGGGWPPLWDAVDALLESALAFGGGVEYGHGLGTKLDTTGRSIRTSSASSRPGAGRAKSCRAAVQGRYVETPRKEPTHYRVRTTTLPPTPTPSSADALPSRTAISSVPLLPTTATSDPAPWPVP
jgi:D-lactate dehydrogenase (cytochrome)